jgi:transposase
MLTSFDSPHKADHAQHRRQSACPATDFVFVNKSNTLMKILYWDGDGFAIWYKRLEVGSFRFPACRGDCPSIEITRSGLSMILEGVDLSQLPKRKRFCRKAG